MAVNDVDEKIMLIKRKEELEREYDHAKHNAYMASMQDYYGAHREASRLSSEVTRIHNELKEVRKKLNMSEFF